MKNFTYRYSRHVFGIDDAILIGAGSAIIGGALSYAGSSKAADASVESMQEYNRGQLELQKRQNEFNLRQYDRDNVYNTPLAQRQRIEQAGLNPNLTDITTGTTLGPVVSSGANLQPTGTQAADIMGNYYGNLPNTLNSLSQSYLNYASAQKVESETNLNKIEARFRADILDGVVKTNRVTINGIEANTELTRKQIRQVQTQTDLLDKEAEVFDQRFTAQILKDYAQIANLDANTEKTQTETDWIAPQAQANINSMNASAEDSRASAEQKRTETHFFKITASDRAATIRMQYHQAFESWRSQMLDNTKTEATLSWDIEGRIYNVITDKATMRTSVVSADLAEGEKLSVDKVRRDISHISDWFIFAQKYGVKTPELYNYIGVGKYDLTGDPNSPLSPYDSPRSSYKSVGDRLFGR